MTDLPSGTVTFLFTDIEGSTALWERDRAAMREAVARQLVILHGLIAVHHGVLYKRIGDGTQAAFASAEDALRAAVAAQRALLQEQWADPPGAVRVRIALHAGEAEPDAQGDYLAVSLNRLSRLLAAGHGGQILLSQTVQQLIRGALPEGAAIRDLGEHRLRDLLEPERVFQLLHPDVPDQFPPLQSLEARSTNLPRQPTPYLGREQAVGEIAALLRQPDVQLLTLTGAGGTGKTRLALQAAAELAEHFSDGVFFVPLAALTDAALVPAAIATAVGVREEGGQPLLERLTTFLSTKHLLLVIDNWEHLLEGAAVLGDLLRAAPRLMVLSTSRAPLHLRAEREYPVPPLALPRRKPPPTLEQLSQYEAVRLFIARAQAVKPDFSVDNANAPAVAEICHRLDGLPLAIELAAARLRLLSPQAMLNRLEQRLPFLTGGARDAPARQQTLRQTIAWSYDLLQPEEQILFRRLAVFTGGFTFDAAEAVANADGDHDVLAGVSTLIDHSLAQQADGAEGEPRFTMLETIREFSLEQLAASSEEATVRHRHAAWGVHVAEQDMPAPWAPPPPGWLARMSVELGNIRAAFDWLEAQADVALALRLATAAGPHAQLHGPLAEGRERLVRALALAGDHLPELRARALWALRNLGWDEQHDLVAAAAAAEDALALFRAQGDALGMLNALIVLGGTAADLGDLERGRVFLEEALALSAPDQPPREIILAILGSIVGLQGDDDRAEALLMESVELERAWRDPWMATSTETFLAEIAHRRGDVAQAGERLLEALASHPDRQWRAFLARCLEGAASLATTTGQVERAARLLGAAEALRQRIGRPLDRPLRPAYERLVAAVRTQLGDASFTVAWSAGWALAEADAAVEAETVLAAIAAGRQAPILDDPAIVTSD